MTLKTGTRIEMHGFAGGHGFPIVAPEQARIARWTKACGPRKEGWHIVTFASGGQLSVHESRFRVIDNR